MKRTTIALPDEVIEKLRAIAVERHISLAGLIRETLAERAASWYPKTGPWPKPKSLGIDDSGHWDTAQRASEGFYPGPPGGNGQMRPANEEEGEAAKQPEDEEWPVPNSIGIIDSDTMVTGRESADWHIFEPPKWRS